MGWRPRGRPGEVVIPRGWECQPDVGGWSLLDRLGGGHDGDSVTCAAGVPGGGRMRSAFGNAAGPTSHPPAAAHVGEDLYFADGRCLGFTAGPSSTGRPR